MGVPSPYGTINMSGNVEEWVEFRMDQDVLPQDADFAPARGGHWQDPPINVRGASVDGLLGAGRSSAGRGIRCAADPLD